MYQEGSTLPYFGKNYPLKIVNHQKNKVLIKYLWESILNLQREESKIYMKNG